jgi:dTDP-4-amino-4,6-dideoxygalactose transaminase
MRNFGHDGPDKFNGVGINAKNSEFHAAMGLCNLKHIESILKSRKEQSLIYNDLLQDLEIQHMEIQKGCGFNYAYYPVIFHDEAMALKCKKALEAFEIFPRRYFYPSLSSLDYVKPYATPVSDDVSKRILCLPLYHTLSQEEQKMIARILLRAQKY